jgi:2-polyprenyl-6-methoxyphenol hydroxylase-like FAD-dependent oxidoreductase
MGKNIAIVGAGIMGRLLALELARRDWSVHLYDADSVEIVAPMQGG